MRIRSFAPGLLALSVLAAAAPAATQTQQWQGIAVARHTFGMTSEHNQPSADAAKAALVNSCISAGWGSDCVIMVVTTGCAAVAYNEAAGYNYTGIGDTAQEAKQQAYAKCANAGKSCDNDLYTCP